MCSTIYSLVRCAPFKCGHCIKLDLYCDVAYRTQKKNLTDEERESQAQSLYSEFLSAKDHVEALTLARELQAPGEPVCLEYTDFRTVHIHLHGAMIV